MPSTSRVHLLVAAGAATLLAGALAGDARADRRAFTRTYEYTTMPEGQTEIEIYSTHSRATFDGATSPQSFVLQLEVEHGIPRNPFINAGALVVLDMVLSHQAEGQDLVLDFVRHACADLSVGYDPPVAEAERATGHRNRALAHFLKSFGNLRNDPDRVLDAYFLLCSISMSCAELAAAFQYLATGGISSDGEEMATARQVKRVNAVMLTCGVYDEAGDYAYRVGLPAKSGVGGGVVAVMPGRFVATVWSPCLSEKGNSLAGTMALELLTTKTALSIF